MNMVIDIIIFTYASLSLIAAGYLFYKGMREELSFDFALALFYLLAFIVLASSAFLKIRIGHYNMYSWLAPLGLLSMIRASILLKTHKSFRLGVVLVLSLLGFFNYYKMFEGDKVGKIARAKTSLLKKNNLAVNIFFTPASEFYREITNFYGKLHKGYNTLVLESPTESSELEKTFKIHKLFNDVNLIYIESDSNEKESAMKVKDLLLKHYFITDREYKRVKIAPHPYLKSEMFVIHSLKLTRKSY